MHNARIARSVPIPPASGTLPISRRSAPRPEDAYRDASPSERRRLAGAVAKAYADKLRILALQMIPASHREDAAQEGAIVLLRALETFDPSRGALWTYAEGAVVTALRKVLRSCIRDRERASSSFDEEEHSPDSSRTEREAITCERLRMLPDAIEALPRAERAATIGMLQDRSNAEMSLAFGVPPGAVRERKRKAIRSLRAALVEVEREGA